MAFLVLLAVAVALLVVSYALMPKPKQPKPGAVQDLDNPTAEAGREIPVIFGTITVKGLNVLDFSEKSIRSYEVKA
ncbi:hypothetical protein [Sphingomonas hankookensis]|uniref:hypothetical protein n=1 Tax=Sphingomonas hankookensis TaxID=563996 RepID=UPI003D303705